MIFLVKKGKSSLEAFLKVNSIPPEQSVLLLDDGYSISRELNRLLNSSEEEYCVLLSTDVILPENFLPNASRDFQSLQLRWPTSAGVTAKGRALFEHGYEVTKAVNFFIISGYEGLVNVETPVTSTTSDFVMIDLGVIRTKLNGGFASQHDDDFDIWFTLELALCDLHVFASPIMSAFAPELPRQGRVKTQPKKSVLDFVSTNFNANKIVTDRGSFSVDFSPLTDLNHLHKSVHDLLLGSLSKGVEAPSLTIVTRTQFGRLPALSRCLESVLSFAAEFDDPRLTLVLASDKQRPPEFEIPESFEFVQASYPPGKDSRFLLVREAVSKIKSDYYFFVDDDDWMFPNHAVQLKRTLSVSPRGSVVFVNTQHYLEGDWGAQGLDVASKYSISAGSVFHARNYIKGLSGKNFTPFCGVVLPSTAFEGVSDEAFAQVEYAEDYFLILRSLYKRGMPIIFDGHLAGISIREDGNTVTDVGATKWQRAKANVGYHLINDPSLQSGKFGSGALSYFNKRRSGSLFARASRVMFDGRLWVMAFRSNVPSKILSGQIPISYVFKKVIVLIKQGW
jgi:hypothetical protein